MNIDVTDANSSSTSEAMVAGGFNSYIYEWWHFTLANEPFPNTYFNFPIA